MPHQQPAPRDPVPVDLQVAHLAVHLADGGAVAGRIVRDLRIAPGEDRVGVFHIRHVDIDDAVEQGQPSQRIVAAGVVDQRDRQPGLGRDLDRGDDRGDHVAGRHEVDVVAAHRLEPQHQPGELLRLDRLARVGLADVVILAELAAQVAPREEDRAGPAAPGERRLFAHVGERAGDRCPRPGAADPQPLGAVDAALPGAEVAFGQSGLRLPDAFRKAAFAQQAPVGGFKTSHRSSVPSPSSRATRIVA